MDNPYRNRKCFECADLRYDKEIGYYCSDDSESLWEGCGVKSNTPACECFTERTKESEVNNEQDKF